MKQYTFPYVNYYVGYGREITSLVRNLRTRIPGIRFICENGIAGKERGFDIYGNTMFEPTCWDNHQVWAVRLTVDDYMTVIDASDVCEMLTGLLSNPDSLGNLVTKSSVLVADKEAQSKIDWLQWEAEGFDAIDDIYDDEEE